MKWCIIWGMWIALSSKSQWLNKGKFITCSFHNPFSSSSDSKARESSLFQANISTISIPTPSLHFLHWVFCSWTISKGNTWRGLWDQLGSGTHPFFSPKLATISIGLKGIWEIKSRCVPTGSENVWKTHSIFPATIRSYCYSQCIGEKGKDSGDKMTCLW